ncbi:MAG: superoxide dismutase family protein [Planctomycetota bacterium]|nr:superoxide dismutase family protein [Planctomycetota bacterium]
MTDPKAFDEYAPATSRATCVLHPTQGNEAVKGTITFTQTSGGVLIEASVSGLTPGLHGFHVHEWGDLDCTDGLCTGGHFNPTGDAHGGPDSASRHLGDFGNLEADAYGNAGYRRVDRHIKLQGPHGIIGRGIVVHAAADDFETQPTGNAGARLATGVIGAAKPQ